MTSVAILVLLMLAVSILFGTSDRRPWPGHGHFGGPGLRGPWPEAGAAAGRHGPGLADVPLLLELLAAALDAGLPIPWALRLVAGVASAPIREALDKVVAGLQMGASWEHVWESARGVGPVEQIQGALSFAALTGAPAAPLLFAEARQRRRQQQREAEKRAAALGVKLVVPLGLCSLPAFVCLGIVPVVMAMVPSL
jgi:pilus assembly protein TadC